MGSFLVFPSERIWVPKIHLCCDAFLVKSTEGFVKFLESHGAFHLKTRLLTSLVRGNDLGIALLFGFGGSALILDVETLFQFIHMFKEDVQISKESCRILMNSMGLSFIIGTLLVDDGANSPYVIKGMLNSLLVRERSKDEPLWSHDVELAGSGGFMCGMGVFIAEAYFISTKDEGCLKFRQANVSLGKGWSIITAPQMFEVMQPRCMAYRRVILNTEETTMVGISRDKHHVFDEMIDRDFPMFFSLTQVAKCCGSVLDFTHEYLTNVMRVLAGTNVIDGHFDLGDYLSEIEAVRLVIMAAVGLNLCLTENYLRGKLVADMYKLMLRSKQLKDLGNVLKMIETHANEEGSFEELLWWRVLTNVELVSKSETMEMYVIQASDIVPGLRASETQMVIKVLTGACTYSDGNVTKQERTGDGQLRGLILEVSLRCGDNAPGTFLMGNPSNVANALTLLTGVDVALVDLMRCFGNEPGTIFYWPIDIIPLGYRSCTNKILRDSCVAVVSAKLADVVKGNLLELILMSVSYVCITGARACIYGLPGKLRKVIHARILGWEPGGSFCFMMY